MRLHLRMDGDFTEHDDMLSGLIVSARRQAEARANRSLITQRWRLVCDGFPAVVELERGPVQSIDSVVYTDMSGVVRTITGPAAPDYAADLSGPVARLTPGFGRVWPSTLPVIGSVQINFTAGYGPDAASVPQEAKDWIKIRVATAYQFTEEMALLERGDLKPLPYVDYLLDSIRVQTV